MKQLLLIPNFREWKGKLEADYLEDKLGIKFSYELEIPLDIINFHINEILKKYFNQTND